MSAVTDFNRLLKKAGAIPYRRYGKIRVACDPGTPQQTLDAIISAVRTMHEMVSMAFPEPTTEMMAGWRQRGLRPYDVCDVVPPKTIDVKSPTIESLVSHSSDYHFQCVLRDGEIDIQADVGHDADVIRKNLPSWYLQLCQDRREEIKHHLVSQMADDNLPWPRLEDDVYRLIEDGYATCISQVEVRTRLGDEPLPKRWMATPGMRVKCSKYKLMPYGYSVYVLAHQLGPSIMIPSIFEESWTYEPREKVKTT